MGRNEQGQATPEWVALLGVVALMLGGLLAAGVRVPGAALARAIVARIACAVAGADSCAGRSSLAAAYGEELARLVRRHAPNIAYEQGMRALPVDFRRCRSPRCADGADTGLVVASRRAQPVAAFVHVVDCREGGNPGAADCSGERAGRLYIQYFFYYPDSATLRGVPYAGARGFHLHDWESLQVRIGPDGEAESRASSHNGYNHEYGARNWGADAGIGPLRAAAEALGARAPGGWGRESGWLFVSGGSHAGSVLGSPRSLARITPRDRIRLIPLEPIAATGAQEGFGAVTPPWAKQVWLDPEAEGTN